MQISQSSISSSANVWSLPLNNLIDYSHYFWVIFPCNYQLELIFVLRESPPLTGISHDKHTFYTHNSLPTPSPNSTFSPNPTTKLVIDVNQFYLAQSISI